MLARFVAALIFVSTIIFHVSVRPNENDSIYQLGYLSQQDPLRSIQVPEGYKFQLVLSDPILKEPASLAIKTSFFTI